VSTAQRRWLGAAGAILILTGLLLPRGWYDALPRQPGYPLPPIKGVTLLQCAIVVDGLLLLWAAGRRRMFTSVPDTKRPALHKQFGAEEPEIISRSVAAWLVFGITGAALALRLWKVGSDLWLDEITPIRDYGAMPYLQVIATYYASNNHLLNTLLGKMSIALFGEHEWAVRLPAVLFGTATVPVLYRVARLTSTRIVSAGAALLLAVSYHHIFFSQNARGYSGHILFSVAAAGLLVQALRKDRAALWGLYVAVMVLNMAVLLHGAFVLAAHALVAVAVVVSLSRSQPLPRPLVARVILAFGLTLLLTFQLYATALPQAFVYITTTYSQPGSGYSPVSAEFLGELVRGLAQGLPARVWVAAVPAAMVAAAGWFALYRRHWALTSALTLPVALTAATLIVAGLSFSPRFFLLALPVAILAGVQGLYSIARMFGARRSVAVVLPTVAVAAGALMSLASLQRYYAVPKQPYRAAVEYVEQRRSPGVGVIAVHLAEAGYEYYAKRRGLRPNEDFFLVRSEEALDRVLSTNGGRPTYVVTTFPRFLRLEYPALEARITAGWTVDRTFPATIGDGAITVWRPVGVADQR
jgi:mannosyltransferase